MKRSLHRREEGVAMMVALIFLVAIGLLATFLTTKVVNHSRQVNNHVDFVHTYEGLESALSSAHAELRQIGVPGATPEEQDGFVGLDPLFDFTVDTPDFEDAMVTPQSIATMQEVEYFAYSINWASDGVDNNGDGQVDMGPETEGYFSIFALARANRSGNVTTLRRTEQIVQGVDVNVWQNAVFAGTGQAGNLINGNVAVHGSVHLLGDNLDPNDPAITAMDMSGTSLVHNNYQGLTADLANRIPAIPTTTFDGETVGSLNATLRVKRGQVSMSGNSEIGQPHQTGNDYKETMDGVYVNDGWTGNDVDVDGDPLSVWSDNGWDETYDLGDAVPFPTFDDDRGLNFLNFYLQTNSDPSIGFQTVYDGDLEIEPGGGSFYWNATTMNPGEEVVGGSPGDGDMPLEADLNPNEFYVWFDDDTDTLIINGRIAVDGDIGLLKGNGGSNDTIDYEGKGTLLAYDSDGSGDGGDVTISANILTDPFPGANVIGVMAENNMAIGVGAQISMMGGFYAQNEISVDKQTVILGTIVGNYFDMGSNVPEIYQVPDLPNSWTDQMRMIGSNPVLVFLPVSWRELGIE